MIDIQHLVIGGGIAGLLAAKRSAEKSQSCLVLESASVFGGAIGNVQLADLTLDSGAEALSIINPEVFEVVKDLGIEGLEFQSPTPDSAWIIGSDSRHQIPVGYMGIPASLSDPELTKVISADEILEAKRLDSQPFGSYESVKDLISERLGASFYQKFVSPVFTGVYGTNPAELDPKVAMPKILDSAQTQNSLVAAVALLATKSRPGSSVVGFEGGLSGMVSSLLASLRASGVTLQTDSVVSKVEKVTQGWLVSTQAGQILCEKLTVAAGIGFLRTAELAPPEITRLAAQIGSVGSEIVQLHLKSRQLNSFPLGPGALIQSDSGFMAKATTHSNAKWQWLSELVAADEHLIRLSFDPRVQSALEVSPVDLLAELSKLYDVDDLELIASTTTSWPDVLTQSGNGALAQLRTLLTELESENLEFCGGVLAGSGISAILLDHQKRRAA